MQPHSLVTANIGNVMTPAQRKAKLGRHGAYAKGTVLPETRALVCPRVKVADLPEGFLKAKHIEGLEHNQLIASCCRHPENHEIEAHKSHPDEVAPDIYIFTCTCGKEHKFFCLGMEDERPMWDAA